MDRASGNRQRNRTVDGFRTCAGGEIHPGDAQRFHSLSRFSSARHRDLVPLSQNQGRRGGEDLRFDAAEPGAGRDGERRDPTEIARARGRTRRSQGAAQAGEDFRLFGGRESAQRAARQRMETLAGCCIPCCLRKVGTQGHKIMEAAAIDAVVNGLKQAGVDFISLMPDSDFSLLQEKVANDSHFTYVPVSNEAIGVGVCAGAWLSGKRPALLVPTSGLLVAAWPLTSLCMAWSLPMLLLIPYRGDIGDAFWLMGPYKDTTEPLLRVLNAPYSVIARNEEIAQAIVDAQGSTISWQRPVAVLLTGETIK